MAEEYLPKIATELKEISKNIAYMAESLKKHDAREAKFDASVPLSGTASVPMAHLITEEEANHRIQVSLLHPYRPCTKEMWEKCVPKPGDIFIRDCDHCFRNVNFTDNYKEENTICTKCTLDTLCRRPEHNTTEGCKTYTAKPKECKDYAAKPKDSPGLGPNAQLEIK